MILPSPIIKSMIRKSIHNIYHIRTVPGRRQYYTESASGKMWQLNLNEGSKWFYIYIGKRDPKISEWEAFIQNCILEEAFLSSLINSSSFPKIKNMNSSCKSFCRNLKIFDCDMFNKTRNEKAIFIKVKKLTQNMRYTT